MSKPSRFGALGNLRPLKSPQGTLHLAGSSGQIQVFAIQPGILRLRVTRGRGAPQPSSSWAVLPQPRMPVLPEVRIQRTSAVLRTPDAEFRIALNDGHWSVVAGGLELFRCLPGSLGFAGNRPQFNLALHEREALFGLGESTGTFNKRGLIRDFWNIDVLGHAPTIHPSLRNLYVSIPMVLSIRDGRAAGLFWDNPCRQTWDMGQTRTETWSLAADSGEIDLYLFTGPTVTEVCAAYTQLTGRIPMPPRWTLGYHQCRYSYGSAEEVRSIAREFRNREIPCDALYLDIHHMDAYRVFTFGKTFPNPARLIRDLASQGFKVVTIVDPGVQDHPDFGVLKRGIAVDAFIKESNGSVDLVGEVWPGKSRFPDFLNDATRQWWGGEQAALQKLGVAGFWNDMNEPANFARPDKTLPPDAVHRTDHGKATHAEVHNLYGMQMSRASREGALADQPDRRPFIITRATYAGGQRHAIVWTGDNASNWDHLRDSVQMLLNLGLSGVPICGADAGGFLDNTTPELFVRWLQLAAFTPFFRNHSNIGTIPQEPWAFGPQVEAIARRVIEQRYQFLQLFYSLVAEAAHGGTPVMRPLLWHYPNDPIAVARGDQFMVGRDLLVAPILEQGSVARAAYLPNETWYDFWTDERLTGGQHHLAEAPLERIPLFVRGGAILPIIPHASDTDAQDLSTVTLNVWPGLNEGFTWYEDDGESQACERGQWHRRTFRLSRQLRRLILEVGPATGSYRSEVRTWRIVLHDVHRSAHVRIGGVEQDVLRIPDARMLVIELDVTLEKVEVEFTGG
jgi:alpha-glucosidase